MPRRLLKPRLPVLQPKHPLAQGLVGGWAMYEGGGGMVRDLSGRGNHFEFQGTADDPTWTTTKYGPGLSFDGTQYLEIPVVTAPPRPLTFVVLFRVTDDADHNTLISRGNTSDTKEWQRLNANGNLGGDPLEYQIQTNATATASIAGFTAGEWHLGIGIEAGQSSHTVQIDNEKDESTTSVNAPGGQDITALGALRRSDRLQFLTGDLAAAYIYNYALPDRVTQELLFDPFAPFRPLRRYWPAVEAAAPGGITQTVAQVVETDSAQAVGAAKAADVGQAAENDLAQALSALKTLAVGRAAETELAQALSVLKTAVVGQAAETDTAQAFTALKTLAVGQVTETELAQAVGALKALAIGQATESDLAQPITAAGAIVVAVGRATEADVARAIGRLKTVVAGRATETELAQALTALKTLGVGRAEETETALAIAWAPKHRLVGQAAETDEALAIVIVAGVVAIYTADVTCNPSPAASTRANPSPAADVYCNPSPTVEVKSG